MFSISQKNLQYYKNLSHIRTVNLLVVIVEGGDSGEEGTPYFTLFRGGVEQAICVGIIQQLNTTFFFTEFCFLF